jgi:hypothetical protein
MVKIKVRSSASMRLPLLIMATLVLGSPAGVNAQSDVVNCEDFGFDTAMGCLDGAQPTAGPAPNEADVTEPTGPDGWGYDGDPGIEPGFLMPF